MRKKLIELLRNDMNVLKAAGTSATATLRLADNLIENGVTIQKWIPVTERLPELFDKDQDWSKTVLFITTQGYIFSGYRHIAIPQKSFYDDDWTPPYWLNESEELEFEDDEVTHWMPLPEPPKGE